MHTDTHITSTTGDTDDIRHTDGAAFTDAPTDDAVAAVDALEEQLLTAVRTKIASRFATQAQAAEALHTFQPRISTIMGGENPLSLASLVRVSHYCGVRVNVELTDDYYDSTFPPLTNAEAESEAESESYAETETEANAETVDESESVTKTEFEINGTAEAETETKN